MTSSTPGGALQVLIAPVGQSAVSGPEVLVRDHLAAWSTEVFGSCALLSNRRSIVGAQIEKMGHPLWLVPWNGVRSSRVFSRGTEDLIERLRPALVLSHGPIPVDLAITRICARRHVPVMIVRYVALRDLLWSWLTRSLWERLDRWVLRTADGVAFAGRSYAQWAVQSYDLDPNRCKFVSVPVDLQRYCPPKEGRAFAVPTILGVGQLTPNKDWGTFVVALRLLANTGTEFTARIIGSGPEEHHIRMELKRLALSERVTLALKAEDTAKEYQRATIYLSTSRREGLSLAAAEAVASGLPVVLSDVSGTEVLVDEGKNGVVIPQGSPEAAVDAMLKVISPETYGEMACQSRALAERVFHPKAIAEQYRGLMLRAVGRGA